MLIGDRLRGLRQAKNLSQGDIQERTGLLRAYVSRVENGHTVPSIETLEKLARALGVPLYQLFYDGAERPKPLHLPKRIAVKDVTWGSTRKESRMLERLRRLLSRMKESDRDLLLSMAQRMLRNIRP